MTRIPCWRTDEKAERRRAAFSSMGLASLSNVALDVLDATHSQPVRVSRFNPVHNVRNRGDKGYCTRLAVPLDLNDGYAWR